MAILKTEKALAKFNQKLQELFEKYGVVKSDDSYPYKLVTETGTLLIHPRNEADRTSGWWIFTRMDEGWDKEKFLERAGKYSSINEYSGKWNVLGHTAELALERIEWQLQVLTKEMA
jgi:hypothetical protein